MAISISSQMEEEFEPDRNPCTFKKQCKNCNVDQEARPEFCVSLECEHYRPCPKCNQNKHLNDEGVCDHCSRKAKKVLLRNSAGEEVLVAEGKVTNFNLPNPRLSTGKAGHVNRAQEEADEIAADYLAEIKVTPPGVPPESFTESEKEYYMSQWEQYSGFYRDPTVYAVVHNLIIVEVELVYITALARSKRGTFIKEIETKQERLINNLAKLRGQLPEKDATDQDENEQALSNVYEEYIKHMGLIRSGGITRVLTREAIVLADKLHFKMDAYELLARLGCNPVTAAEAVEKFIEQKHVPEDPEKFLEFMGYSLHEKYAMPEGVMTNDMDAMEESHTEGEDIDESVLEGTGGQENTHNAMGQSNQQGFDFEGNSTSNVPMPKVKDGYFAGRSQKQPQEDESIIIRGDDEDGMAFSTGDGY